MPSDRTGMSEREYARHVGVSRGAVRNARAAGRLVFFADGSIDAAASDARRAQVIDPSKQRPLRSPDLATAEPVACPLCGHPRPLREDVRRDEPDGSAVRGDLQAGRPGLMVELLRIYPIA